MSADGGRNILASLMQRQANSSNQQGEMPPRTGGKASKMDSRGARPTSVLSNLSTQSANMGKQHKLSKRFTVIRKLGKGTYGKVQLAINKETGQEVAIKTIKKSKIDNEDDMQRVRREIQIMRSIEHPHIIHIYEEFENKDKIVLIMQYAPGGELYEYVSQSKLLDDGEARRLFRQIATAIYYCHQNKICHRDLKLENILLDEKNNAKLADFGLSNVFDKQTQLRTFCGSPLYASPEIVQGSPYKGPEVDCWSLGVLLYTLVYGAMPFDGSNFKRLVKQISDASYYEPTDKSPASPLIRHLLCADPMRRATIIDICSDPWVNGLTGKPLSPLIRVGSPTGGGQTNHELSSQHPSLLKVAQDMANLTPVRMDMLLALTMGEQLARQQREEAAARPPVAPLIGDAENISSEPPPRRVSPKQTTLDPSSIMEVDEPRATSPIASYIVRDLEPPPLQSLPADLEATPPVEPAMEEDSEKQGEQEQAEQEDTAEISIEQDFVVIVADSQPEEIATDREPQTCPIAEVAGAVQTPPATEERAEPSEKEQAIISAPDSVHPKGLEEVEQRMQVEQEGGAMAEPDAGREDKQEDSKRASVCDDKTESAPIVETKMDDPSKEQVPTEAGAGDETQAKPKKLKKKIVVVKKKKKVSKKCPAAPDDNAEQQQLAIAAQEQTSNDKSEDVAASTGKQQPTGAEETNATIAANNKQSRPGKVKIPNTFQASEQEPQVSQVCANQGRRQSALIADVSQKLLQSVMAEPKPAAPTIIESDQLQLRNVRVSDKKDELERRASLAQQQAEQLAALQLAGSRSISPAASSAAEQQVEALQAELVREMAALCAAETVGSAQIDKLEPRSSVAATPIGRESDQQRLLPSSPADDRSDSLETIRAADQKPPAQDESNSVRSSLQIDLSPLREVCKETLWQQQVAAAAAAAQSTPERRQQATATTVGGPAPIARSYKKVTFTRDGACITETGKIYSTQANDGTLRRVERKSKVTHYPDCSGNSNNGTGSISESHKEEQLVYCDSPLAKRNLQRLIMPAQFGQDSDSDHDEEPFLSQPNRGSSLFSPGQQEHERRQQFLRDRKGSGSSCSSGSTDVLEDIFDSWTGAISMFNRPHSRLFERASSRLSSGSFGRRRNQPAASSQTATPRCESVEPQSGAKPEERYSAQQHRQQSSSGYESDAAAGSHRKRSHSRRPNKPGSARGLFGSWNLLNELDNDDLFSGAHENRERKDRTGDLFAGAFDKFRNPFEVLEQEQQSLRARLAQQHKQLWKGSSPSLFDDIAFGHEPPIGISRKPPPVVKDPRLPTGGGGSLRPASGQVGQSHSSSSFKVQEQQQVSRRTATPLEAAPIRRNTTNFSPIVKKSTSSHSQTATKTCTIFQPTGEGQTEAAQEQRASTFIELKRTSSSLGSSVSRGLLRSCSSKLKVHQQQQQQFEASASNQNSATTSSSSFWNSRETPPISHKTLSTVATPVLDGATVAATNASQGPARESVDRRVQSWLQESSGNLSAASSASKSSQSISDHSMPSGRRAQDPFENLYGSLWQTAAAENSSSSSSSRAKMVDSPNLATGPFQETGARQLLGHSISGSVVISRQKQQQQSIVETTEGAGNLTRSMLIERNRKCSALTDESVLRDDEGRPVQASSRASSVITKQTTGRTTSPLIHLGDETPQTATSSKEHLSWVQQSVRQTSSSRILSGDHNLDLDSLAGVELESHSSSSLLDQLKSGGYRSMINKRMIDVSDSASSSSATRLMDQEGGATRMATTTIVQQSYSHSSRLSKRSQQNDDEQEEEEDNSAPRKTIDSASQAKPELNDNGHSMGAEQPETSKPLQGPHNLVPDGAPGAVNDPAQQKADFGGHQDDDQDEDVREAKASIKGHLERAKETELFLASLKKDEEIYERQRQQMLLFNDLVLGTKLTNFKTAFQGKDRNICLDAPIGTDCSFYRTNTGLRSAPVRNYHSETGEQENGFLSGGSQFLSSSAALSFEPTYILPGNPRASANYEQPSPMERNRTTNDPIGSYTSPHTIRASSPFGNCSPPPPPATQVYDCPPKPLDRFRRSRSQLSDQFVDYKRQGAFATRGAPTFAATNETYHPSSAKRSLSQLRYSSARLSQPIAMSEYRSAYGNPSLIGSDHTAGHDDIGVFGSARASNPTRGSQVWSRPDQKAKQPDNAGADDDDDDGMSAYRVSSYVPKVVPTLGTSRGRSRDKRRSDLVSANDGLDDDDRTSARQRRTSLQAYHGNRSSPSGLSESSAGGSDNLPISRRRSLTGEPNVDPLGSENSRLSELEQRIKENRRRREDLLAGKLSSPEPPISSGTGENHLEVGRRDSSPAASPGRAAGCGLLGRPSRLESMEARIKRKSYCVRIADCASPDRIQALRGQVSLEKWRQSQSQGQASSARSQNRSDSLIADSSNLLLSSIATKRRPSIVAAKTNSQDEA